MSEKFTTQNKAGLWNNDNKQEPWQDDYKSKIYISEPGWHWIGAVEKGGEGKPAMQVEVRKMTQEMTQKYCHDIKVLTKRSKPKRSMARVTLVLVVVVVTQRLITTYRSNDTII